MIVLTEQDYFELEPIVMYFYYQKEVTTMLESYGLHNDLVKQFILEATTGEPTKQEADELFKEFQQDANELSKDDMFSGIARLMNVINKSTDVYKYIASGGVLAWPLRWMVGKVWKWRKTESDLKDLADKQQLLQKAQEVAKKKGIDPTPENLGRIAKELKFEILMKDKQENIKKLQAVGSIWSKLKAKVLKIWLKIHPEKISYKLADLTDKIIRLAMKYPYLVPVVIVFVLGLILLTIFKWNTIKHYVKLIIKFITAPFRFFFKGLKWIFTKLFGSKRKPEQK